MKYKKLIDKFETLVEKHEEGEKVKPGKFDKIQGLLIEKKKRYEEKLESIEDPEKRQKLQTRIKVVDAQLEKSRRLPIGK